MKYLIVILLLSGCNIDKSTSLDRKEVELITTEGESIILSCNVLGRDIQVGVHGRDCFMLYKEIYNE